MPTTVLPSTDTLAATCRADGELRMAVRYWTGGLRLLIGDEVTGFTATSGAVEPGVPEPGPGVVTISGSAADWEPLLRAVPPRFCNDIAVAAAGALQRTGDDLTWWQYLPAIQRCVELLRAPGGTAPRQVVEPGPVPRHDSPVGRYVHVELGGLDHRIYYEEAGRGIPLLLQHTAGSHGTQWRHLFECGAITDHFRLIAYDLPFHGKSVPPVGGALVGGGVPPDRRAPPLGARDPGGGARPRPTRVHGLLGRRAARPRPRRPPR